MGKKPVVSHNRLEDEDHTDTARDFPVENIASRADLDKFETRMILKTGGMIMAAVGVFAVFMTVL